VGRHQRGTSVAATIGTFIIVVLAWLVFAPTAIGGSAAYVIVNGNSMEPCMRRGDLVIVRRAARYEVGDVVTYRHPTIGAIIHRIVDRHGERFVLQGDNNPWLDSYHPSAAEIVGREWLHIPGVGSALAQLRNPHPLLLAAGVAAGALLMTRNQRPRSQRARGVQSTLPTPVTRAPAVAALQRPVSPIPTLLDAKGREAAATLLMVTLVSLVAVAFTFSRPAQRPVTTDLTYEHSGIFSYTAPTPEGIYDRPQVTTGAPVFRQLTERISVTFDYQLSTDALADITGSGALVAVVSNSSGWGRTLALSEPITFTGRQVSLTGELDLRAMQQLTDTVATRTGVSYDAHTIAVRPQITLAGSVAGQPFQDTFEPELTFRLGPLQLQLADSASGDTGALHPARAGLLKLPGMEPNGIPLLRWELSLALARTFALAVLAIGAGMLAAILLQTQRVRRADEVTRIQALHGPQLIPVTDLGITRSERLISLASFDDLLRLAERAAVPLLFQHDDHLQRFVVNIGAVSYQYLPVADAATPEPSAAVAEVGAQA
jgi:signal peptidase I